VGCTNSIQQELLEKAEKRLASMTRECSSYDQLKQAFLAESNQGQGFFLVSAPFPCLLSPKERKEQPRPQPGCAPMCPPVPRWLVLSRTLLALKHPQTCWQSAAAVLLIN
jgi:hypothetical protein